MSHLDSQRSNRGNHAYRAASWVVLLVLAVVISIVCWRCYRGWTVNQLERVARDEVPLNCSPGQVESVLTHYGIRNYYSEDLFSESFGGQHPFQYANLRVQDVAGAVVGILSGSEVRSGFLERGIIYMYFFFDKKGQLVAHWITRVSLSL